MAYRPLTVQERRQDALAFLIYDAWLALILVTQDLYGGRAQSLVWEDLIRESPDDRRPNGIEAITAHDVDGLELDYDRSTPFWQEHAGANSPAFAIITECLATLTSPNALPGSPFVNNRVEVDKPPPLPHGTIYVRQD